ncbi:MAG TPA: PAAR domain-containing protein [Paraburkholderia sp.]|jgi:uncharacterized Zn-binding protein involved in type VI secretion
MRKAAVRNGDPTTTGGFVIAYSSTIHDNSKKVALSGDHASCGNCKGAYEIFGTGKGMSEKGRNVVVDGDLVMCPCGKNRVIVGSNPGIFLGTSAGSGAAAARQAGGESGASSTDYDELEHYFEIVDAMTGEPIEGMTYKLLSDGASLLDNKTLASGKTLGISKSDHPNLTFIAWRKGNVR